jgi:hypothetical protein
VEEVVVQKVVVLYKVEQEVQEVVLIVQVLLVQVIHHPQHQPKEMMVAQEQLRLNMVQVVEVVQEQ